MSTLVEQLGKQPHRPQVISDCVELIDHAVKQKGFVIKSPYATIKAIKKRFVPEVVDSLLDDWLAKLQPHYAQGSPTKPSSPSDFLGARSADAIAEPLSASGHRPGEATPHPPT